MTDNSEQQWMMTDHDELQKTRTNNSGKQWQQTTIANNNGERQRQTIKVNGNNKKQTLITMTTIATI